MTESTESTERAGAPIKRQGRYREFAVTTGSEDIELHNWYRGRGMTLDRVIGEMQQFAREWWEEQEAYPVETAPEAFSLSFEDYVVWEFGKVKAVLRVTVEAAPEFEVTRFDRPGNGWRTFKVMSPRVGDLVTPVEGFVTPEDAVRVAVAEILLEDTSMTPDDRLIFEGGELVQVVRANIANGNDGPTNPEEEAYAPDDEARDAQAIRRLIARGRTPEEAEAIVRGD